jgi:hypothetical protein
MGYVNLFIAPCCINPSYSCGQALWGAGFTIKNNQKLN